MPESKKVVTRFAPSPTGKLHLGSYRTAIFSYLYAKHNGGKFIVRIEDTDKQRSTKAYEENILESLAWLGLEYDGEIVRQSERAGRHKEILEKLIAGEHAYISKEKGRDKEGNETDEIKELVRFKNPNEKVTFHDIIRGEVTMDTTDLGDFVIAKNINEPLFHLAVVADDFDAGVTHVIRGEDHLSNTPRHILLQRAIGATTPEYAHLPLVLGQDRQKLSKRKGALAVTDYRDAGYLPEAILNAAAMIGWNPGTEQEVFTKEELIEQFDLTKVQKGGATLNPEKLDWFNREHIKKLSDERFLEEAKKCWDKAEMKFVPMLRERITKFGDIKTMHEAGEFDYFFNQPTLDPTKICFKTQPKEEAKMNLEKIARAVQNSKPVLEVIGDEKKGPYLHPLRYALSGRDQSPDPFTIMDILGKEETFARIEAAIALL